MTLLKCAEYPSTDSQLTWTGVCMLPKQTCDVKAVQIARILKITQDRMGQLSFVMPRSEAQKGSFQDELYSDVPTWDATEAPGIEVYRAYLSSGGSAESVRNLEPKIRSLCPAGMQKASEVIPVAAAGEEGGTKQAGLGGKLNAYKAARIREEQEKKVKDGNFAKLQALAQQRATYHPNLSMGEKDDDSSDSGWDD